MFRWKMLPESVQSHLALGETVVTGVANQASKLNSGVALTTLNRLQIERRLARGTRVF